MAKKVLSYHNGRLKGKYLTDEECDILDRLIEMSGNNGYIKDLKRLIYDLNPAEIDLIKQQGNGDGIDKRVGELEDLQTLGVAFLFYAKRAILGDSVGLGKTVVVSGLFNLLKQKINKEGFEFRFLYLTEKNLVAETRDKLVRFTGDYVNAVYGEKKYVERFLNENRDDLHYSVVGSHSLAKNIKFQEYLQSYYDYFQSTPFDILVIDEAGSVLGNRSTQMYEAMKAIGNMFDMVVILNATAFENNLSMFYNQLSFVDDSLLPTITEFNKRYVEFDYSGPFPKPSGKYKNADEFRRLVGYRYFSRTRKSTGARMENCTAEVFVSDLSPVQKELLKRVSMPNMVYDCPGYFMDDSFVMDVENTPKLGDLVGLVSDLVDKGESVLIYAMYREAQSAIQDTLFSYGIHCEIMNGSTKIKEKNDLIAKFKAGDLKVLITNVQKGLDFGRCNHCIFYCYDPSPNKMVQFEGRMTREYNIIDKHVYLLISRGSELTRFKSAIADKAKASDMFAGSDFSCVMSLLLSEETLKKLK